jgi:hypothetical protein
MLKGVAYPTPWCCSPVSEQRSSLGCCSSACSIPRRLVLLDNLRCGAEQRWRTTLATTTTSKDLACNGSQRGFQHGCKLPVQYKVARQRRQLLRSSSSVAAVCARGKQRHDFEPWWWSAAWFGFYFLGGGAPLRATSTVILAMTLERGAVRWVWGPRARESGVLSGESVVPAHARVASDSVFFTLSGGRFWCNNAAALGPARRWPFRCGGA